MSGLVLASRSAVRAALLRGAGVDFSVEDAKVDEAVSKAALIAEGASPLGVAQALAEEKALAVSRRRAGLIIGADQTLELDGALYDKPTSQAGARERLWLLRGRTHALHSAVSLAHGGTIVWREAETARLTLRAFSEAFLDDYLRAEGAAALASVGAYRLEGTGVQLFQAIEGDYFAILGLPLLALLAALRAQGALPR